MYFSVFQNETIRFQMMEVDSKKYDPVAEKLRRLRPFLVAQVFASRIIFRDWYDDMFLLTLLIPRLPFSII